MVLAWYLGVCSSCSLSHGDRACGLAGGNLKHVLSKEMLGLFGVAKLPVGHAMSLGIGSSGKVVMGTCGLMGNDADVGVCFSGKP